MRKITFLFIITLLFTFLSAQELLNENFDAAMEIPTGWNVDGSSDTDWIVNNFTEDHTSGDGNIVMFNCYTESNGTTANLYTPTLEISEENNTLSFWVNYFLIEGDYGNSAELYLELSDDSGENWTTLSENLIEGQDGNGWFNIEEDLSTYNNSNVNIRFHAVSDFGSFAIALDDVSGPEITQNTEVPSPTTLVAPEDNAINISIDTGLEWNTALNATGYKLFFGTSATPENHIDLEDATSYQPENILDFNTQYYWQIIPYNDNGDAVNCPVWSFTTQEDTSIYEFPWSNDFNQYDPNNWPPENWVRAEGELTENSELVYGTYGWASDEFLNIEDSENKSARVNIYGTARIHWLITPFILLPENNNLTLSFDIALTQYGNSESASLGEDDRFDVVISPDGSTWSEANILREWTSEDDIANFAQNITISLSDYSGLVRIGFYGESLVTNEDVDFFMDNIEISAETVYAPYNLTGVYENSNVVLDWEISDQAADLVGYNVYRDGEEIASLVQEEHYEETGLSSGEYEYYVTAVYNNETESDASNTITVSVNVDAQDAAGLTQLIGNYPNPFNPETTIEFNLKEKSKVKLVIYNILGQKIKTVVNKEMSSGKHKVAWNGKDESEKTVSNGVYFYRMKNGKYTSTKKMILLK